MFVLSNKCVLWSCVRCQVAITVQPTPSLDSLNAILYVANVLAFPADSALYADRYLLLLKLSPELSSIISLVSTSWLMVLHGLIIRIMFRSLLALTAIRESRYDCVLSLSSVILSLQLPVAYCLLLLPQLQWSLREARGAPVVNDPRSLLIVSLRPLSWPCCYHKSLFIMRALQNSPLCNKGCVNV